MYIVHSSSPGFYFCVKMLFSSLIAFIGNGPKVRFIFTASVTDSGLNQKGENINVEISTHEFST